MDVKATVTTLRAKIECRPFKPVKEILLNLLVSKKEEKEKEIPLQKTQSYSSDSNYSKYKWIKLTS